MRALTIRQPYADAIVHVDHPRWGRKRIENRSWAVPAAHLGTRILIHAAKTGDRRAVLAGIAPGPDVRGAVIGTATLTGCHFGGGICLLRECGPWANPDAYHWTLADVIALPEPVPTKGSLQFWTPTDDVLDAVYRQIEAVPARPPRAPTDHVYKGRPDWAPSKLTPAQRADITRRLADGEPPQALAAEYQVSGSTIRRHR